MDATTSEDAAERLLLHGIADPGAMRVIGPRAVEFAGTPVRAIQEGRCVALVSLAPQPTPLPRWLSWLPRPTMPSPGPSVLSAISSLLPVLPVAPGTLFESEDTLRHMLRAREIEIAALVREHAGFLECELTAGFNKTAAEEDLIVEGPIAQLHARNEAERSLVERSLNQSIAGRQAQFLARFRRRIVDASVDILPSAAGAVSDAMQRRVLISREGRAQFCASLHALAEEIGAGAWLRLGPFMPPLSFRCLDISSADPARVNEARVALGVDETAEHRSIRLAYQRTVERVCSHSAEAPRRPNYARLEDQFSVLNLVAEGQIRASRGETLIRFDPGTLKNTWLLRFHMHDLADRAA